MDKSGVIPFISCTLQMDSLMIPCATILLQTRGVVSPLEALPTTSNELNWKIKDQFSNIVFWWPWASAWKVFLTVLKNKKLPRMTFVAWRFASTLEHSNPRRQSNFGTNAPHRFLFVPKSVSQSTTNIFYVLNSPKATTDALNNIDMFKHFQINCQGKLFCQQNLFLVKHKEIDGTANVIKQIKNLKESVMKILDPKLFLKYLNLS